MQRRDGFEPGVDVFKVVVPNIGSNERQRNQILVGERWEHARPRPAESSTVAKF
jgi:hypothetical protein